MATCSNILAWRIPRTEELGVLQSMGYKQSDMTSRLSMHTHILLNRNAWRRKWQTTPVFCLENPMDGGAWWATVHGVAKSRI